MPKKWKCARCSTTNVEPSLTCSTCRMIRGAVVVPGTFTSYPGAPSSYGQSARRPPATGPAAGEWAVHASDNAARLARVPIGRLILGLTLVGAVVAALLNATGSPFAEFVDDRGLAAGDLRVGDCFDMKRPSAEVFTDLKTRRCSELHQYEVFLTGSMTGRPYPDEDAFEAFYDEYCVDAFYAYVGTAWADSSLEIYWMVPTEDGWAAGEHSVECSVYDPVHPRLTHSLKAPAHPENQPQPL